MEDHLSQLDLSPIKMVQERHVSSNFEIPQTGLHLFGSRPSQYICTQGYEKLKENYTCQNFKDIEQAYILQQDSQPHLISLQEYLQSASKVKLDHRKHLQATPTVLQEKRPNLFNVKKQSATQGTLKFRTNASKISLSKRPFKENLM
ncbi:hypothetical protein FGO68_gene11980 [Halteria grandinella]|uniref:Uncharacterized protein n=1 Tax=Halteria grandinella TaxID=5974 RepID=A0A8J8NJ02_HALGN|nr:hypothetical protein FGO68_gene11980 [Halteria grandinella]